jgi:hypothetical protein
MNLEGAGGILFWRRNRVEQCNDSHLVEAAQQSLVFQALAGVCVDYIHCTSVSLGPLVHRPWVPRYNGFPWKQLMGDFWVW